MVTVEETFISTPVLPAPTLTHTAVSEIVALPPTASDEHNSLAVTESLTDSSRLVEIFASLAATSVSVEGDGSVGSMPPTTAELNSPKPVKADPVTKAPVRGTPVSVSGAADIEEEFPASPIMSPLSFYDNLVPSSDPRWPKLAFGSDTPKVASPNAQPRGATAPLKPTPGLDDSPAQIFIQKKDKTSTKEQTLPIKKRGSKSPGGSPPITAQRLGQESAADLWNEIFKASNTGCIRETGQVQPVKKQGGSISRSRKG